MPKLTAVYVDFTDAASYRVWRWLAVLGLQGVTDVRPYSLDSGEGGEADPWNRTTPAFGLELLALAEFARDAGPETHRAFVDAAFALVHDTGRDPSSPESMLLLGAAAGLDLGSWTADSERWRAEVGLYHREGEDELGVRGVPSLVFDDEHAMLVALQDDVQDEDAARRLLADLTDLAVQPVAEVRKTA